MVELDRLGRTSTDLLSMFRDGTVSSEEADFLCFAIGNASKSHAQLFQDLWVLFELGGRRNGYFVEFGAADGVELSNTVSLERLFGWRGALAEPCPVHHAALRANRNRCFISEKGIGPERGQFELTIAEDPLLSTFEAFSQVDHHSVSRAGGRSVTVEVQSLNDFLDEASAPKHIDFLSIDTEGSEADILRGFDWSSYSIETICIEHNFNLERSNIYDILNRRGYRRRFERLSLWDDWYVRN